MQDVYANGCTVNGTVQAVCNSLFHIFKFRDQKIAVILIKKRSIMIKLRPKRTLVSNRLSKGLQSFPKMMKKVSQPFCHEEPIAYFAFSKYF